MAKVIIGWMIVALIGSIGLWTYFKMRKPKNKNKCRFWKIVAEYFSYYSIKKLKENKKLVEILIALFITSFIFLLSNILYLICKDVFPANFDRSFVIFYRLLFLVISIFLILFIYIMAQMPKLRWINSYWILIGIVMIYVKIEPFYLKILVTLLAFIILLPSIDYLWKPPNWMLIIIFIIILVLLIFGLFLINNVYGNKIIDFRLNNCTNTNQKIDGMRVICSGIGDKSIVGYNISCRTTEQLKNLSGSVTFTYPNGTFINRNFINQISFIAPDNIEEIFFRINGTNNQNKFLCLSTKSLFRFPTYSEYNYNREKFMTYLLGLLFLSLITVPSFLFKIRDNLKKKKN